MKLLQLLELIDVPQLQELIPDAWRTQAPKDL